MGLKGEGKTLLLSNTWSRPYVQILHRLGDIELVHSGDDDGRRCEEEEQDEEYHIDN